MPTHRFHAGELTYKQKRANVLNAWLDIDIRAEIFCLNYDSTAIIPTGIAEFDFPANGCFVGCGSIARLCVRNDHLSCSFPIVLGRLEGIEPQPSNKFHRVYRWSFLIVGLPTTDVFNLFPARPPVQPSWPMIPYELALENKQEFKGEDISLDDLTKLLGGAVLDEAKARFTAEGGFTLER